MANRINTSSPISLVTLAAAPAGTFNSDNQLNESGRGVQIVFDVTTATTTSVVLKIQGYDVPSTKYYDLLTSAAVTGTGTVVYTLYPGVTVASNVAVSASLPRVWRVNAVVTGSSSALTATVGANVLL